MALSKPSRRRPYIPHGADPLTYYPGIKKDRRARAEAPPLSEEMKQRREEQWAKFRAEMKEWNRIYDTEGAAAATAWLDALQGLRTARIAPPSTDEQARIAVEGNTAVDDVPFEESGE